jgi:hypothetical protein
LIASRVSLYKNGDGVSGPVPDPMEDIVCGTSWSFDLINVAELGITPVALLANMIDGGNSIRPVDV